MSTSLFPAAIAEAKAAKLSVSLFLVLALIGGGYYLGQEAGRGVSRAEVEALEGRMDRANADLVVAQKEILVALKGHLSTVTVLDNRVQNLSGQVEVVKSKVDDCRR